MVFHDYFIHGAIGKQKNRESYVVHQGNECDTYEVIPIQYLYNTESGEMEFMRFPPEISNPSGLRIMWVYSYSGG